jgi:hypothetical protein
MNDSENSPDASNPAGSTSTTKASKQLEVRTSPPARPESTPRMPHERDESEDSQAQDVGPDRENIKQAYKDLENGQVNTDLWGEQGLDQAVNGIPVPTVDKVVRKE